MWADGRLGGSSGCSDVGLKLTTGVWGDDDGTATQAKFTETISLKNDV